MDIHDSRGNLAYRVADKQAEGFREFGASLEISMQVMSVYKQQLQRWSRTRWVLPARKRSLSRKKFLKLHRRVMRQVVARPTSKLHWDMFRQAEGRIHRAVPPVKVAFLT